MLKNENDRRVRVNFSIKKSLLKKHTKICEKEKISKSRDIENYIKKRTT